MKTENLTWTEAIKAYAVEGKRIRSPKGREYWIDIDRPMKAWPDGTIEHFQAPIYESGDWSIVVPEEKSLSFDEAIKCGKVRIHPPSDCSTYLQSYVRSKGKGWGFYDLYDFDLADRKGWKMVEVKE